MAEIIDLNEKKIEELKTEAVKAAEVGIEQGDLESLGLQELGALLALSEEAFSQIAPIALEKMETNLKDPAACQAMYYSFVKNGGQLDQLNNFYNDLMKGFEEMDLELSQSKKDFLKQMIATVINAIERANAGKVVRIPIEVCHEDAKIPQYANETDAGLDVYALDDYTIHPGETMLIPTGLKIAIPQGYEVQVRPKSGRALKTKLRVANTPGTIDAGYRDEVKVIIENIEAPIKDIGYHFDENGKPIIDSILHGSDFHIGKGEKFAQLVLNEIPKVSFYEVEKLSDDGNRGGGFGSSGLK